MMHKSVVLSNRPVGVPQAIDFKLVESEAPIIQDGQVLIRTLYLSVDPYMRERMTPSHSYMDDFRVGEVITGATVGQIVESKHTQYQPGQVVSIFAGWQEYNVSDGTNLRVIPTNGLSIPLSLGVLGSPGLTAYFGLLEHGQPKEKETVVISGAGGAVGSVAGQIAKLFGCRVVGISGSDEKNKYLLEELGFDAVINYKKVTDLEEALERACPDGIDIYFDNVGNDWINSITKLINRKARLLLCGQISQYNGESPTIDSQIFGRITKKTAKIQGFMITDYNQMQAEAARKELTTWIVEGKLKNTITILDGMEQAVTAFTRLFLGDNTGKLLIHVANVQE